MEENHFHVVVGAAPRYAPSRIMQIIKSITAREFFREYPEVRNVLWGAELWSDGWHIDTVSEYGGLEKIKKYVLEQGGNLKQLKLLSFS
jgi:putative transposase